MTNRLLDRQARLLEYLSSAEAVFGDQADAAVDPALREIDRGALRLLARFACNKRIDKIIRFFPRTFEIFGADQRLILREFVEVSPPTKKSSLVNAREFHEFLSVRWQCEPPEPAYLPDVATCELALAEVRAVVDGRERLAHEAKSNRPKRGIRRRQGVVPLRCAHDIQSIFDAGPADVAPPQRDTSLVVTIPAGLNDIKIIEVAPIVVDALMLLDNWAHPSTLDAFGDGQNLINHLAAHGLIEVTT